MFLGQFIEISVLGKEGECSECAGWMEGGSWNSPPVMVDHLLCCVNDFEGYEGHPLLSIFSLGFLRIYCFLEIVFTCIGYLSLLNYIHT